VVILVGGVLCDGFGVVLRGGGLETLHDTVFRDG